MMRLGPWAFEVTPASYCLPVFSESTVNSSSYRENATAEGNLNSSRTVRTIAVLIPWAKVTRLSGTASELSPDMFTTE